MAFTNEQHRQRYAEDPEYRERKLALNRGYHAEHREALNERRRERSLARLAREYGIAFEELRRMLSEHDGTCDICRRRPARRLCIDHCHATMKVRGLLCQRCNTALGLLEDDPERLRAAIGYLERARGAARARGQTSIVADGAALGGSGAAAGHVVVMRAEAGCFELEAPPTPPVPPRSPGQGRGGSRPRLPRPDCVSAAVPEQRCSTRARNGARSRQHRIRDTGAPHPTPLPAQSGEREQAVPAARAEANSQHYFRNPIAASNATQRLPAAAWCAEKASPPSPVGSKPMARNFSATSGSRTTSTIALPSSARTSAGSRGGP